MKTENSQLTDTLLTSQNDGGKSQKKDAVSKNSVGLYQKCLTCPDYGTTCNGPKLAALGDIMVVRSFHRAIRDQRSIPMKLIYLAASSISESTINDYFSHSAKDFKWTTVGCIDNALTAICGNRVGQPPLDHPCPASSTEIQSQIGEFHGRIEDLMQENFRLQEKVTETKGKIIATREEVKEDYASRVQFLKELCIQRQGDIDVLNRRLEEQKLSHQKDLSHRDAIAADYLSRIDEKNKRIDGLTRANHTLVFFLICALLALTCYLVWDIMHPGVGLFTW